MTELILHAHTAGRLADFAGRPSHAALLTGPVGVGKASAARYLAAQLLGVATEGLQDYPHLRHIAPAGKKSIGIEDVRQLEHFLSLKIPGGRQVARIAIIEDAHLMTHEAQNALLKTLEEPPADTVLILTAAHEQALLPTIRSRLQTIAVKKAAQQELEQHFAGRANGEELRQALAISGGLPGLTAALLSKEEAHPLLEAVQVARSLLQGSAYDRLVQVDALAKRKDFCRDVCFVLMQMAQTALTRTSGQKRWQQILAAAYRAEEQLLVNAQTKLVLTNLMLSL